MWKLTAAVGLSHFRDVESRENSHPFFLAIVLCRRSPLNAKQFPPVKRYIYIVCTDDYKGRIFRTRIGSCMSTTDTTGMEWSLRPQPLRMTRPWHRMNNQLFGSIRSLIICFFHSCYAFNKQAMAETNQISAKMLHAIPIYRRIMGSLFSRLDNSETVFRWLLPHFCALLYSKISNFCAFSYDTKRVVRSTRSKSRRSIAFAGENSVDTRKLVSMC